MTSFIGLALIAGWRSEICFGSQGGGRSPPYGAM
jgi:hypothetical protein